MPGTNRPKSLAQFDPRYPKEEYLDHWKPQSFGQLKTQVKKAVKNYNNKRSHDHLKKRNPEGFINYWSTLKPEGKRKKR